jgi:acyl-CoA synthetase (AMP-forming)/AMP-acid ligase II
MDGVIPRPTAGSVAAGASPAAVTLWDALAAAAAEHPGAPAVCRGEETWSYGRLLEEADGVRRRLAGEVDRGPVLFVARNTPSSLAFLIGSIAGGKVPLLADPAWGARELEGVIRRCGARAVAWDGGPAADLACVGPASERGGIALSRVSGPEGFLAPTRLEPDTAFGRFTSGTSGHARCLQFRARAALAAAASWREAAGLSARDRVLCLATLNNGLAFNTSLLALLLAGGTLTFHAGRLLASSVARTLAAVDPTVLVAFPFVFESLVGRKAGPLQARRLRLAVSSAAPLSAVVRQRWEDETGLRICDYYGLAEVGPCTFNDGSRPGSVGVALPGVSLAITDADGAEMPAGAVGRIRVQTPSMASGYLDTAGPDFAEAVDQRGYYVTQDLGLLTPEGDLVLGGRIGRLVNIAGRKIDPAEVEAALRELPGVRDAVVRGEVSGERTVLAAYLEGTAVSREEVVRFCLGRLAQYKIPQLITILPRLPRSSAGKISLGRIEAGDAGPGPADPEDPDPRSVSQRASL